MKTVEEKNKIIAKWMGETGLTKFKNDKIVPYDKTYNVIWQSLMPVVEKITQMKCDDYVEGTSNFTDMYFLRTFGAINTETGEYMVRINRFPVHEAKTLLQATFEAVSEFVFVISVKE